MSWLQEGLEAFVRLVTKSVTTKVVEVEGIDDVFLCGPDGPERVAMDNDRGHAVYTVDSLVEAARRWNDGGTIWVSDNRIELVIDDKGRKDRVTWPLVESAPFRTLRGMLQDTLYSQADLVWLLTNKLGSYVNPEVIRSVRTVDVSKTEAYRQQIGHGKESMGKSIDAKLTNAETIPETFNVLVPVYGHSDDSRTVVVDLVFDFEAGKFRCTPREDRFLEVIDDELGQIEQSIIDVTSSFAPAVLVLRGRP